MNDRDWGFAMGDLGDPLADIEDWMLPPFPKWMSRAKREGSTDGTDSTQAGECSPV